MSLYFKTFETKTNDPDKIDEEIFPSLQTNCWEISFQLRVNPGLS